MISIFLILLAMTVPAAVNATTLDEALKSALAKNEMVAQADERVAQAESRYDQAKSGPLPNLALNASHLVQPPPSNPIFREFSPERQTSASLTLTQPLFRGFREFAALRQTGDLRDAQKTDRTRALAQLYEMVATAYLQVLSLEQDLRNLGEQSQVYSQRVRDLVARSRRGESARNEPLTAQSAEATIEAETQWVETQLRSARENFAYLTGLPASSELKDPSGEPADMPAVQKLDYYLARVESRPDIQTARKLAEAADEGVSFAKGAHWPSADVVGNYYLKRPDGFLSEIDWDVQFRLTLPLYEGGLRVSQTQEAASKKREADLEVSRVRRLAATEIRTLHESLMIRARHLQALKRSSELSKKNSTLLERDFRRGLTRNIDVALALAEYGVARRSYDQARYGARLDLIRLERAANILPTMIASEMQASKVNE